MIKNKYNVGDKVYYNLPGGEQGIVLDWCYYFTSNTIVYEVTWGPGQSFPCTDKELITEKIVY